MSGQEVAIAALILLVGFLYSTVGHAGASGYLAVMGLMGLSVSVMKPTSLTLNIVVAVLGAAQFLSAGHFRWRLFWPFALMSVPLAYLGGKIVLPGEIYKPLIGLVLLFSAWRLWAGSLQPQEPGSKEPNLPASLAAGAGLGFVSGLTGTGGGIFLSPLLLLCRWATAKETAAVSVCFILVNSIAGLVGALKGGMTLPGAIWVWALCAAAGGTLGSFLGARRFGGRTLRRLLAVVLVIAGAALIWDGAQLLSRRSPTSVAPAVQSPVK